MKQLLRPEPKFLSKFPNTAVPLPLFILFHTIIKNSIFLVCVTQHDENVSSWKRKNMSAGCILLYAYVVSGLSLNNFKTDKKNPKKTKKVLWMRCWVWKDLLKWIARQRNESLIRCVTHSRSQDKGISCMDWAAFPSTVQLDPVLNVHSNMNRFTGQFSFLEPLTPSLISSSSLFKTKILLFDQFH